MWRQTFHVSWSDRFLACGETFCVVVWYNKRLFALCDKLSIAVSWSIMFCPYEGHPSMSAGAFWYQLTEGCRGVFASRTDHSHRQVIYLLADHCLPNSRPVVSAGHAHPFFLPRSGPVVLAGHAHPCFMPRVGLFVRMNWSAVFFFCPKWVVDTIRGPMCSGVLGGYCCCCCKQVLFGLVPLPAQAKLVCTSCTFELRTAVV